jgi:PiT family inorganic phosphate transporter
VGGGEINHLEVDKRLALAALLSVLIFVTFATIKSVPVATSHTMIGSIVGVLVAAGLIDQMNYPLLSKLFISWISTPIAAIIFALVIYKYMITPLSRRMDILTFDRVFRISLIIGAVFLSYSLGANTIGNAVGPVVGSNAVDNQLLVIILVGVSMGLGVRVFSGGVVETVGNKITSLGPVMAFTSQLAAALVIYVFTVLGIPVSTTQAVVGGVIGVGLTKGTRTVNVKTIEYILIGWILTPIASAVFSMLIYGLLVMI